MYSSKAVVYCSVLSVCLKCAGKTCVLWCRLSFFLSCTIRRFGTISFPDDVHDLPFAVCCSVELFAWIALLGKRRSLVCLVRLLLLMRFFLDGECVLIIKVELLLRTLFRECSQTLRTNQVHIFHFFKDLIFYILLLICRSSWFAIWVLWSTLQGAGRRFGVGKGAVGTKSVMVKSLFHDNRWNNGRFCVEGRHVG